MVTATQSDPVDEHGTAQDSARQMLAKMLDDHFHGSAEELSLVMGRPADEIERFRAGNETIDDDFVMKLRGVARARQYDLE